MTTITEKLGAASLENEEFRQISEKIIGICSQKKLSEIETADVPNILRKRGVRKAVKFEIGDLPVKWINRITLYVFDIIKYDANFGGCFIPSLSTIENRRINATIVLPMVYPDYDASKEYIKSAISKFSKNDVTEEMINKYYDSLVRHNMETINSTVSHEFRHAFDTWAKYLNSQALNKEKKTTDDLKIEDFEGVVKHVLTSNDRKYLDEDPNWIYPSQDISELLKQHRIATVSKTGCTIGFFQANMYYLETDEINAFFESITENIKKIYKNEPYVFSNFDQVKKYLPEGKILYINIEFLHKYITLWRETKKFIKEATLEDYSNIMAANSKAFAYLMMKFKYPNFKKTDPKFNAAMDKEIQKGTSLMEYMEYKASYLGKKLQNFVSIVYDFCQRFRKEEYCMIIEMKMNKNDYTMKFRLKANPVLLMQTYHILEYWIRKHATVYLMSTDELDSKHPESDSKTITDKLYSDIIKAYTYQNRNILYELDEKAERFRRRINTLDVSKNNLAKLLELYFKHMKVDYKVLD